MSLLTEDYDYPLPKQLIAHTPNPNRDHCRLMTINRQTSEISHHLFSHITNLLKPNDVLVINDSKVIKARLIAHRTSGAKIEILLLYPTDTTDHWYCLIKNSKKLNESETLHITDTFSATLIRKNTENTHAIIALHSNEADSQTAIEKHGQMPLPPYIQADNPNAFEHQYQTIYARHNGSVAAPTAGLHFTESLLASLRQKGVQIIPITLHVGYGTFKPIDSKHITDHHMHSEPFIISEESAKALSQAKINKQRLIAVGTTVTRTLEAAYTPEGFKAGSQSTNIFIYPGYTFKAIDGLITNFHLPKSTLLCLVSAFMGNTLLKRAYTSAIKNQYKFYSFGDAMIIL